MNLEIEENNEKMLLELILTKSTNYAGKYPLRNPLINTYCYFEESRI